MLKGRFRRGVAAVLLAMQAAACTSWHAVDLSPQPFAGPERVRLTLADSSRAVRENIVLAAGRIGAAPDAAVGWPVADVRRLEVRRVSWTKTSLLLAAIAGTTLAALKGSMSLDFGSGLGGWNGDY